MLSVFIMSMRITSPKLHITSNHPPTKQTSQPAANSPQGPDVAKPSNTSPSQNEEEEEELISHSYGTKCKHKAGCLGKTQACGDARAQGGRLKHLLQAKLTCSDLLGGCKLVIGSGEANNSTAPAIHNELLAPLLSKLSKRH